MLFWSLFIFSFAALCLVCIYAWIAVCCVATVYRRMKIYIGLYNADFRGEFVSGGKCRTFWWVGPGGENSYLANNYQLTGRLASYCAPDQGTPAINIQAAYQSSQIECFRLFICDLARLYWIDIIAETTDSCYCHVVDQVRTYLVLHSLLIVFIFVYVT